MNLVRYYLAFIVVVSHFNYVFNTQFFLPTSSYDAVGGFFALSGFLVYGSYSRYAGTPGALWRYVKARARRILPPYLTIVLTCALGLVCLSSLAPADYFSSVDFWKYVAANLTFLNFLHPALPGVFDGTAVNGSLWTLKVEWMLYLSVPIVVLLLRRCSRHVWQLLLAIVIVSMIYRYWMSLLYQTTEREIYNILSRQFFGQLTYFYVGVAIRLYLERFMRWKHWLAAVSLALMCVPCEVLWYHIAVQPVAVSILAMYVSIGLKPLALSSRLPNISYSIYLFHLPIMLVLRETMTSHIANVYLMFALSVAMILVMAMLSWRYIESYFYHPTTK